METPGDQTSIGAAENMLGHGKEKWLTVKNIRTEGAGFLSFFLQAFNGWLKYTDI